MQNFNSQISEKITQIKNLVSAINSQLVRFGPAATIETKGSVFAVTITSRGEEPIRYSTDTRQSEYQSHCQILNYLDQVIDELEGSLGVTS